MALSALERASLASFRERLAARFGDRVERFTLFGSRALGEGHEESDLDVLVLVRDLSRDERRAVIDDAGEVEMESGLVLSPLVRDTEHWSDATPLGRAGRHFAVTGAPLGNAGVEIALARETLEAARVLEHAGLHRHAVGRTYYAIFHAACALLSSIGRTSRTHDGVRALINEHFVRPGLLEAEHARALRQTAADRNDADYDADYDTSATFDAHDSAQDIRRAEAFLAAVERLLALPGA